MRQGSTLHQLSTEVVSIAKNSRDFSVNVQALPMIKAKAFELPKQAKIDLASVIEATEEAMFRQVNGLGITGIDPKDQSNIFRPTNWAHGQIAKYSDVPKKYYDRILAENPALLADNVNHGFGIAARSAAAEKRASGRIIRTHKGIVRAMVSSRFRRLDNYMLAEAVFPILEELGFTLDTNGHNSFELTDRRMFLKFTTPKITADVKPGDTVQYGVMISNSDVGSGSLLIEPYILRLVCTNGMVMEYTMRKAHLGGNQDGDGIEEMLRDETKELENRAFFAKVGDIVRGTASREVFEKAVNVMREAAKVPLINYDLPKIIETTLAFVGAPSTEGIRTSILENLAAGAHGAGLTKYGLANAITYSAEATPGISYDDATDLERAGSHVLVLGGKAWAAVNAR